MSLWSSRAGWLWWLDHHHHHHNNHHTESQPKSSRKPGWAWNAFSPLWFQSPGTEKRENEEEEEEEEEKATEYIWISLFLFSVLHHARNNCFLLPWEGVTVRKREKDRASEQERERERERKRERERGRERESVKEMQMPRTVGSHRKTLWDAFRRSLNRLTNSIVSWSRCYFVQHTHSYTHAHGHLTSVWQLSSLTMLI